MLSKRFYKVTYLTQMYINTSTFRCIFAKTCYNRVALDELNYDLRSRNRIIKLQLLIYNKINVKCVQPCEELCLD